ncbi:MAG: GNAT family N-acetyltransferase [Mycobacteriales bacterium]
MPTLADRVARVWSDAVALHASRPPTRSSAVVAGIPVAALGLPPPWATSAHALHRRPDPAAISAAVGWLARRSSSYAVFVRAGAVARLPLDELGLAPDFELPALAMPLPGPAGTDPGLQIALATDPEGRAEFVAAYAGAGLGMELAGALIAAEDVADPAFGHLVGRVGDQVVGCALLRQVVGAGYVSAVAVPPAYRRRGYGSALTLAAGALAARRGADLAVIHATGASQPLYERLGYRYVDTHVALVPRR